ncbi:hypothetical protein U1Q18_027468 [Sarracenia purpurea var. burkii]
MNPNPLETGRKYAQASSTSGPGLQIPSRYKLLHKEAAVTPKSTDYFEANIEIGLRGNKICTKLAQHLDAISSAQIAEQPPRNLHNRGANTATELAGLSKTH